MTTTKTSFLRSAAFGVVAFGFAAVAPLAHALIVTPFDGVIQFELLDGRGATSTQEFGIGTPSLASAPADRQVVFIVQLVDEVVQSVTPSAIVNWGLVAQGTELDFYNLSHFGGIAWSFSSHLSGTPSSSDLQTFRDGDNSLGLGGSVVENVGLGSWILHLDDAHSADDDDNELLIRVALLPVPEPSTALLFSVGCAGLCLAMIRRSSSGARRSSSAYAAD